MNRNNDITTSGPVTVVDTFRFNWWLLALRGLIAVLFGVLIVGGLFGIIAGLLTLVMPGITALGLLILIAAWAITTGVMELIAAVRLRKIIANEWLLVLAGIASVAFGIILLVQPAAGALALIWWIAAWAIVSGILLLSLAFRMRGWKGFVAIAATEFR